MLRHARLAQPQPRDQVAHRPLAPAQQVQDLPPGGLGESGISGHDNILPIGYAFLKQAARGELEHLTQAEDSFYGGAPDRREHDSFTYKGHHHKKRKRNFMEELFD
jgi:hypothetical protein